MSGLNNYNLWTRDNKNLIREQQLPEERFKGAIPAQEFNVLSDEFDPISIAASEALPGGIVCACGEKINKGTAMVTKFRGHIQNECRLFAELRELLLSMKLPEGLTGNLMLPGLVELYPFTTRAPTADNKDDSVFYMHWLKNVPLCWRHLFLKNNYRYAGLVKKVKMPRGCSGFKQRLRGHVSRFTINFKKEQMIGLVKGKLLASRILESLNTALLNKTECSVKNGQIEILPLIGLSEAELRAATNCSIYLFERFADSRISQMDPHELKATRIAYRDAEIAKAMSLNVDEPNDPILAPFVEFIPRDLILAPPDEVVELKEKIRVLSGNLSKFHNEAQLAAEENECEDIMQLCDQLPDDGLLPTEDAQGQEDMEAEDIDLYEDALG